MFLIFSTSFCGSKTVNFNIIINALIILVIQSILTIIVTLYQINNLVLNNVNLITHVITFVLILLHC